jgi:hypothetical protein
MNNPAHNGLLARQWSQYSNVHANRRNLLVHAVSVPLFMMGTLALPFAGLGRPAETPSQRLMLVAVGFLAMVLALMAQGRMHRHEACRPTPFRGPFDAIVRLFAEQWITFPRFVLSGKFGRALRRCSS